MCSSKNSNQIVESIDKLRIRENYTKIKEIDSLNLFNRFAVGSTIGHH